MPYQVVLGSLDILLEILKLKALPKICAFHYTHILTSHNYLQRNYMLIIRTTHLQLSVPPLITN